MTKTSRTGLKQRPDKDKNIGDPANPLLSISAGARRPAGRALSVLVSWQGAAHFSVRCRIGRAWTGQGVGTRGSRRARPARLRHARFVDLPDARKHMRTTLIDTAVGQIPPARRMTGQRQNVAHQRVCDPPDRQTSLSPGRATSGHINDLSVVCAGTPSWGGHAQRQAH